MRKTILVTAFALLLGQAALGADTPPCAEEQVILTTATVPAHAANAANTSLAANTPAPGGLTTAEKPIEAAIEKAREPKRSKLRRFAGRLAGSLAAAAYAATFVVEP